MNRILSAVTVILPNDHTFAPESVHDVSVRVGITMPSADEDISGINALCTSMQGPLGTERGQIVRIQCDAPVKGRLVTIQIR